MKWGYIKYMDHIDLFHDIKKEVKKCTRCGNDCNWCGKRQYTQADVDDLKDQLKEVMSRVPGGHFCNDWDGMFIKTGDDEMEACLCLRK